MKSKLIAAVLLASSLIAALPVEAGSIGRSSSSSSSSRSSESASAVDDCHGDIFSSGENDYLHCVLTRMQVNIGEALG